MKSFFSLFLISFPMLLLLHGQTYTLLLTNEPIPENIPLIYGKGIISNDSSQLLGISFSPGGDELIYAYKSGEVYYMKRENNKWTKSELMLFSEKSLTHIMYPKFSPDGKFISFVDGNSPQFDS